MTDTEAMQLAGLVLRQWPNSGWGDETIAAFIVEMSKIGAEYETARQAVMSLRLRRNGLASVNVTMLTHGRNFEGSITILGEKGTVRVGGVAVNEIQHWEFAEQRPEDEEIKHASYATTSVYGFGHPLYYDNVIQTLRGEAEAETDGREGLKSLELLIAMYLSSRDGKRVALPLEY